MTKRVITKDDGRYLIYYNFTEEKNVETNSDFNEIVDKNNKQDTKEK